jgi:hypothetical protein
MRAKRACATTGCPNLTDSGRCADCTRKADKVRGTRQQRGYDAAHERARAYVKATLSGRPCARGCGHVFKRGEPFHLDHTDDRDGYLGPSCPRCNLSAAGKKSHT